MYIYHLKSFSKYLMSSITQMVDSDSGRSMPETEKVQEKIKKSKNRKVPVVSFIFLFVVIVLVIMILNYFI